MARGEAPAFLVVDGHERGAGREEGESLVEGDDRRAGPGEGAQGAVGAVGAPQVEEAVDALVVQRHDVARLERGIQLRGADDDRVAPPGRGDFGGVYETAEEGIGDVRDD